jgi:hypothetical protein
LAFSVPAAGGDVCLLVCFHLIALNQSSVGESAGSGHCCGSGHRTGKSSPAEATEQLGRMDPDIGHCIADCAGTGPAAAGSGIDPVGDPDIADSHSYHTRYYSHDHSHYHTHYSDLDSSGAVADVVEGAVEGEVPVADMLSGRFEGQIDVAAEEEAVATVGDIHYEP